MARSKSGRDSLGNLIFLSYRRADSAAQTLALMLEFETQFRAAQVFVDTRAIQGGDLWRRQIDDALHLAKVFIPVIGNSWTAADASGKRRIDDKNDWVHREVAFALAKKPKSIVPIFVDGSKEFKGPELPKPLRALADHEGMFLNLNSWDRDIRWIVGRLSDEFDLELKNRRIRFPKPDPQKARTIPVPWQRIEAIIKRNLRDWRIEFSDDPEKRHYKRVELTRDFEFTSFKRAVKFMDAVAVHASRKDHHPRLVNLWRTVSVYLATWDAGYRVTHIDVAFARHLDEVFKQIERGA